MNLKDIIDKLTSETEWIDDSGLVCTAKILREITDQLTPRLMDQKPRHGQWCLLFNKDTPCLVSQYNMYLDAFVAELSIYKSESFKWLPAPVWKEDE